MVLLGHTDEVADASERYELPVPGTARGERTRAALLHAAEGVFGEVGYERASITAITQGAGVAQDAHVALDQAAEKIDKQLRRYKRRLNDRHEQTAHAQREEDAAYVIFAEPPAEDEEVGSDAPVVIAETRVDVPEATVSDAVMMLDLRNTNALLFKNAGTGRHNMVYRRGDGSIGWVEPS